VGLPDHQLPESAPCGLALGTRVVGGVVIAYPCGFATFRPNGERCAMWKPDEAESWISKHLPIKAPL
jgi:hypothetical protein